MASPEARLSHLGSLHDKLALHDSIYSICLKQPNGDGRRVAAEQTKVTSIPTRKNRQKKGLSVATKRQNHGINTSWPNHKSSALVVHTLKQSPGHGSLARPEKGGWEPGVMLSCGMLESVLSNCCDNRPAAHSCGRCQPIFEGTWERCVLSPRKCSRLGQTWPCHQCPSVWGQ